MSVPSNQNHTATIWIEPFGLCVAKDAIYRLSSKCWTLASDNEAIGESPRAEVLVSILREPHKHTGSPFFSNSKSCRQESIVAIRRFHSLRGFELSRYFASWLGWTTTPHLQHRCRM